MTRTSRYLLLLACVLIFLILAPLIVIYVSGLGYDFKTHQFYKTGIISVRTDPKDAKIYLDGKLAKKTSGDITFLKPGEYNIAVKKDGYFEWSKRLRVDQNLVTWANPVPGKLTLFLNNSEPKTISGSVLDFAISGDRLAYLTAESLTLSSLKNPQNSEIVSLPKPADHIIGSADGNFFALTDKTNATVLVFDAQTKKITDISDVVPNPTDIQFSNNDDLYELAGGILNRVTWKVKEKTPEVSGVIAFYIQDNNLYLYRQAQTGTMFTLANISSLEEQTLAGDLPTFSQVHILVNAQKEAFMIADGTLYKVNNKLEPLADSIADWQFEPKSSSLIVAHAGEMGFYNQFDQRLNFITRTGSPLKNPLLIGPYNFALYFKGNDLNAIELDTRDHQNEYTFYKASNPQKFTIDDNLKNLLILDAGNLKMLKIR